MQSVHAHRFQLAKEMLAEALGMEATREVWALSQGVLCCPPQLVPGISVTSFAACSTPVPVRMFYDAVCSLPWPRACEAESIKTTIVEDS